MKHGITTRPRKPYVPPQLWVYGDVATLTGAGNGIILELLAGSL